MLVGVMQPYFFPYFGYFQLINSVDSFIIHDDVQYIKGGWISRNRLSKNGNPDYFTVSVSKAPSDTKINCVYPSQIEKDLKKISNKFFSLYSNSPNRSLVVEILKDPPLDANISGLNVHFLKKILEILRIDTKIVLASEMNIERGLRASEKVISLVKSVGGDHYINPIGGTSLYSGKEFSKHGIKLSFLCMSSTGHLDGWSDKLSILDLIARNELSEIRSQLSNCTLSTG
jgi:hypothetical protein